MKMLLDNPKSSCYKFRVERHELFPFDGGKDLSDSSGMSLLPAVSETR